MPEHVHLLFSEPQQDTLADALKSLKQGVSRRLIGSLPLKPKAGFHPSQRKPRCLGTPGLSGAPDHFWQKKYYDFNIRNYPQFVEKLRYIHRNPAKRGLSERPENWEWSSFRHYATGCEGRVEIEGFSDTGKFSRSSSLMIKAINPD
jgi:putative transposase